MTGDWFTGIPAARAEVECGSDTHTITWRDGHLRLDAHPDADLDAERAISALAGRPCRCIQLLDAWAAHAADPRVLVLGPRDHENRRQHGASPRLLPRQVLQARSASAGADRADPDSGLWPLLTLDGSMPHRLVATVAAALSLRPPDPGLAPVLHAAVYGRLLASIWRWTGPTAALELQLTDGERSLTRHPDQRLVARLPVGWISEVWARELDLLDDRLTLSAALSPDGDLELVSVDRGLMRHIQTGDSPR